MLNIKHQQRLVKFFHRQQEKKMTSHAYLLHGENTNDIALYMAMSFFCDENEIGACQSCSSCMRALDSNHSGLFVINPDDERLKKNDIINLKKDFSQTALESRQKRVYIIHEVDKATPQALNSLLKFLEEPTSDITAILTTSSLNRVLDTIQSRCLILNLEDESNERFINKAIEEGYDPSMVKATINLADTWEEYTELLEDKQTIALMDGANEYLNRYQSNNLEASVLLHGTLINNLKVDINDFSSFLTMINELTNDYELKEVFVNIQDRIRPGVNANLLVDQFIYYLLNKEQL